MWYPSATTSVGYLDYSPQMWRSQILTHQPLWTNDVNLLCTQTDIENQMRLRPRFIGASVSFPDPVHLWERENRTITSRWRTCNENVHHAVGAIPVYTPQKYDIAVWKPPTRMRAASVEHYPWFKCLPLSKSFTFTNESRRFFTNSTSVLKLYRAARASIVKLINAANKEKWYTRTMTT